MSVVTTSAYSAASAYPLNHARIGWHSWADGLASSAVVTSSAEAGFPKDAPLRPDTFEKWKAVDAATWRADLGESCTVDYVGILGDLKGVTVSVHYSHDDSAWSAFSASVEPTDNAPVMFLDAPVSARYWRVTLGSAGAVARVQIGLVLEMQRPFFGGHAPLSLSRQTQVRASRSRGGQFLGQDIVRTGFKGSMAWRNLTPDWYRNNFDPLVKHLRTRPAFVAWNALKYSKEVIYGWCTEDISPVNVAQGPGGRMEVSINIEGVGFDD